MQNAIQGNEYITIIARDAAEAMGQFRARRLGERGYTMLSPLGRHEVIAMTPEGEPRRVHDGTHMVAATFVRRGAAPHDAKTTASEE